MNIEEFKADILRRFPLEPGMNYMAVDIDGKCYQYSVCPKLFDGQWGFEKSGRAKYIGCVELPSSIDWRDTLISRAETTQPAPPTKANDAKVWLQIYCSIIATGHSPDFAANSADYAFDEYKKRFQND